MNTFPVFEEFFPIFPFLSISTFIKNIMQNSLKLLEMEKFLALRHSKDVINIFADVDMKKQGRIWHIFVSEGGKVKLFVKIFILAIFFFYFL